MKLARTAIDWGKLAPLRLHAQGVADGVYAGWHRSRRRGSGIEFGGHRAYVPGDDLRFIDRHALLRHGEPLVRQFETETDRTLCLLLDASASMSFRSERGIASKFAFAALLAAALAKVAVSGGDRVALSFIARNPSNELATSGGRQAFERVVGALESIEPSEDLHADRGALERAVVRIERRANRGANVVVFSDLLDLPDGALELLGGLAARGRNLCLVRVLDPTEIEFPFTGPVHLRALERPTQVETDGASARADYLAALAENERGLQQELLARGGRLLRASSGDDAIAIVRRILDALGGRPS
ncbi:MAG TPA: DUF58 domain-containing protein [Polyangiaceae bacterium]